MSFFHDIIDLTGGEHMPLFILGLAFAAGLFIYYMVSTSGSGQDNTPSKEPYEKTSQASDLKKEGNVIFLPTDIEKAKKEHRRKQ